MNKTWKIFGILLLAANLFVLNSCGLLDVPEQEWEEYDVNYSCSAGEITLKCYVMFTSEETSYTGKNSTNISIPAGLSVMIIPDADCSIDVVQNVIDSSFEISKNYILKTFPLNESVEIQTNEDDETQTQSFKMTKTKWALVYHAIKWNEKDATDPKTYFKDKTEFSLTSTTNFSWKKLLKSILYAAL